MLFRSVMVELLGIQILPFAVGLYLPIHLSTPIIVGGILRGLLERRNMDEVVLKDKIDGGVLYSSGLIAGEGLIGILLAVLAIIPAGVNALGEPRSVGDVIAFGNNALGQWGSLVFFGLLVLTLVKRSFWEKAER